MKSSAVRNWFLSIAFVHPQDTLCTIGFHRNPKCHHILIKNSRAEDRRNLN